MKTITPQPVSLLKSTRQAKAISLEAVHEATKIPMDVLRAIEEGYTVRTLSPFYLRGFIKMYAQYLQVNVKEIIPEYAATKEPPSRIVTLSREPRAFKEPGEFDFDATQWAAHIFTHRRKKKIVAFLGFLCILFALFKIITFFTHRRPPSGSSAVGQTQKTIAPKNTRTVPVAVPTKKKSSFAPSAATAPRIATTMKSAKSSEPSTPIAPKTVYVASHPVATPHRQIEKDIVLTIRTKKDNWLRVDSDGVIVYQGTLGRGKAESWNASKKIEISGKNIDQLEFELNGKLLGSLTRRQRNAKKVVITPEGLSVIP